MMKKMFNRSADKADELLQNPRQLIVSIHDDELGHFNRPMFFRSRSEALIALRNSVVCGNDPMIAAMMDVMSAHIVGEFDEATGQIFPCQPVLLCRLFDFAREKKEVPTDEVQNSVQSGDQ